MKRTPWHTGEVYVVYGSIVVNPGVTLTIGKEKGVRYRLLV